MIKKANYNISLSISEFRQLISIKPWSGSHWDKTPNNEIKAIKSKIREQLNNIQSVCSYCGLKLGGTSNGEIEHIAPKASFRHPEFTFIPKNLTLACHLCNGFSKKGTKDTVSKKNNVYAKCEFDIVHPYFDNPNDHFEWTDNQIELLIQVKNNSTKGTNSIKLFKLDSPLMNELRAQQIRFEEFKISNTISQQDEDLINTILNYKNE